MVKHVSFDLWGTIIKSHPEYKTAKAKWLQTFMVDNFNLNYTQLELELAIRNTGKTADYLAEQCGLTMKPQHIIVVLLNRFIPFASDMKAIANRVQAGFDELILEYCPQLIQPETIAILQQIRARGITMNVASNTGFTSGETMNKVLKELDIISYFKSLVYSERMGFSKPDKQFFEKLYLWEITLYLWDIPNDISRDCVLHVGDNPHADGLGAKQYGFQSLIINTNDKTLADVLNLL